MEDARVVAVDTGSCQSLSLSDVLYPEDKHTLTVYSSERQEQPFKMLSQPDHKQRSSGACGMHSQPIIDKKGLF
jgi:hypothetical protein